GLGANSRPLFVPGAAESAEKTIRAPQTSQPQTNRRENPTRAREVMVSSCRMHRKKTRRRCKVKIQAAHLFKLRSRMGQRWPMDLQIPTQDQHRSACRQAGARRHVHQAIRVGERTQTMRGLSPGGTDASCRIDDDPHEMATSA